MSVSVSPVPHAFLLADDFLTLDHWYYYGENTREYQLRTDVSVGSGNALSIEDDGLLRLARETDLVPGEPVVVFWWAYRRAGTGPTSVQLRSQPFGDGVGSNVGLLASNASQLHAGWNHCVATATPPASWERVRISLWNSATSMGGMIAGLRVTKANQEGELG